MNINGSTEDASVISVHPSTGPLSDGHSNNSTGNTPARRSISLCIGAPKCGTTWLDDLLRQRLSKRLPQTQKETFYFDRHPGRGDNWYGSQFRNDCKWPIEVAPSYLNSIEAAKKVSQTYDDVRLLVMIRDPYQRSASDILHNVGRGRIQIENVDTSLTERVEHEARTYSQYQKYIKIWQDIDPAFLAVVPFPIQNVEWFADVLQKFAGVDDSVFGVDWLSEQIGKRVYSAAIPKTKTIAFATRYLRELTPKKLRRWMRNSSFLFDQKVDADLRQTCVDICRRQFDFSSEEEWMQHFVEKGKILVDQTDQQLQLQS